MTERNIFNIKMQGVERSFEATLHFLAYEPNYNRHSDDLIAASFVGYPEAVLAMSSGIIEARPVFFQDADYARNSDKLKKSSEKSD